MANGVARLSPHYCRDSLRWRSLGASEGAYFARHVLGCRAADGAGINAHFFKLGLPEAVCRDLVNPGFVDPFDPVRDITLDNPAYRFGPLHLMTGKLDWALVMGLRPVRWRMEDLNFERSDHRLLLVEVEDASG